MTSCSHRQAQILNFDNASNDLWSCVSVIRTYPEEDVLNSTILIQSKYICNVPIWPTDLYFRKKKRERGWGRVRERERALNTNWWGEKSKLELCASSGHGVATWRKFGKPAVCGRRRILSVFQWATRALSNIHMRRFHVLEMSCKNVAIHTTHYTM